MKVENYNYNEINLSLPFVIRLSDTLTLQLSANGTSFTIPVIRKGIAWPSDKNTKFQNPPGNLTKGNVAFLFYRCLLLALFDV